MTPDPSRRCWKWRHLGCRKEATRFLRVGSVAIHTCADHDPIPATDKQEGGKP